LGVSPEKKRNISANVADIRSFSEAERKKNLGENLPEASANRISCC